MKCESCVYGVNVGGKLHCASPYFPKPKIYEKVDNCKEYEPIKKPITKADRIRAMSDEELAEFFGTLPCCPPGEDLEELCFPLDSCEGTEMKVKCWLKWLRQEATS